MNDGTAQPGTQLWVFTPRQGHFPAGIWSTREGAEKWITEVGAEGVLSAYIADEPAYDSNVRLGRLRLDLGRVPRTSNEYKRTFTTAVEHFHYGSEQ